MEGPTMAIATGITTFISVIVALLGGLTAVDQASSTFDLPGIKEVLSSQDSATEGEGSSLSSGETQGSSAEEAPAEEAPVEVVPVETTVAE